MDKIQVKDLSNIKIYHNDYLSVLTPSTPKFILNRGEQFF